MDETRHRRISPDGPEKDPEACNLCGLSCMLGDSRQAGGICAIAEGGYFSTPGNGYGALDDMTQYRFQLCEFCLDWLFQKMQIPPEAYCRITYKSGPFLAAEVRAIRTAAESAERPGADPDAARANLSLFLAEKTRRDLHRAEPKGDYLHYRPCEGPCEAHDWPTEGMAQRLVIAMRDRQKQPRGKGGFNVCLACLERARDGAFAAADAMEKKEKDPSP